MSAVLNQEKQRAGRTGPPPRRQILSPSQAKSLARVGFRIPGLLLAVIATVVLVTLVSVNSDLTGTFGAIAGVWFAVHLVPLSISGTSLGVFPLLPTLVLGVVVARSVGRTVTESSTRRECAWLFGAAVLGPLFVTVLALAIAADASAAIGLSSPRALVAFGWVAAIHAVSAAVGLVIGTWDSAAVVERVPTWMRDVVGPTVRAASVLVAGGAAIVLAAMVASWSTMSSLLEAGNGFVGVLGLTVLSVLYLPNVVIGSIAVAVGSSAHIGDVSVSQFGTVGGPVPPLPVLAVLPEGAAQPVWMLMLIVPVTAGVFLGRDCARRTVVLSHALSSVWTGAGMVGVAALIVGFAAGGNLGTFGTVQVTAWSLGLLTFAWLAVVGSVVAAVTAWRGDQTEQEAEAEPGATPVPVDHAVVPAITEVAESESSDLTAAAESESAPAAVVEAEVVDALDDEDAVPAEVMTPEAATEDEPPLDVEVVGSEVVGSEIAGSEVVGSMTTEDLPDKPQSAND
ncbi:MAG: DUF6350 family protein [Rhodococcus sp. (in: high G+C Gram-positive bacteria)]